MQRDEIVRALETERDAITKAIHVLSGKSNNPQRQKRRHLSALQKRKMSRRMKKFWRLRKAAAVKS